MCKDCKWWLVIEPEDKHRGPIGECYRYPPAAEMEKDFSDLRPLTLGMDFCGEFIRRGTDGGSRMTTPAGKE